MSVEESSQETAAAARTSDQQDPDVATLVCEIMFNSPLASRSLAAYTYFEVHNVALLGALTLCVSLSLSLSFSVTLFLFFAHKLRQATIAGVLLGTTSRDCQLKCLAAFPGN